MPKPTTYDASELLASRDGLSIYGQLFLPIPTPTQPIPTIVCAHDFGANYLSCTTFAWDLVEKGFAVYCFDFCGGGYAARSDGNPLEMTIPSEVADLEAVMAMLRDHPLVDEQSMHLLGVGQGAVVATLWADEHPDDVASLVLLHPTFNMHDVARRVFPTKKNIPTSYRLLGMRVGRSYGETCWDINPYSHMSNYKGRVLIVHGDEDTSVSLDYARRAKTVLSRAKLVVVYGGRHVFRGPAQERAKEAVVEFLTPRA